MVINLLLQGVIDVFRKNEIDIYNVIKKNIKIYAVTYLLILCFVI